MPVLEKNRDRDRDQAARHSAQVSRRSKEKHAANADIGEIPAAVNPERKEACRLDLHRFLVEYFPHTTGLKPFSDDHRRAIARMQDCGLQGGRNLNVLPRGAAKSTISENTALWLTLYGHRRFVSLFGMNLKLSSESLDAIKMELTENDLLSEDFPEVCFPFRALEGRHQRCRYQTHRGELTHILVRGDTIVYPTVGGSAASAAIVIARPYRKARGVKFRRPDGTQARPDFAIIDDPQDAEMAHSPIQVAKNLAVLRKDIAQSGGHRRKISLIVNATVIEAEDMIDTLLKDPSWQGERIKMVIRWAEAHESHWMSRYRDMRATHDRNDPSDQRRAHERATAFYAENREAMDRGAATFWKHCFDPDTELSAIQHAYNMLIDDGADMFASECQNEPLPPAELSETKLTAADVVKRVNAHDRGIIPAGSAWLVAYVDIQKPALFYEVGAVGSDFTTNVIDYGPWPEVNRAYFSLDDIKGHLSRKYKSEDLQGSIFAALSDLMDRLAGREWKRDDGTSMRLDRCLIDANWDQSTKAVYQFCRESKYAGILLPSHGKGVTAGSRPFSEYTKHPGDVWGEHWIITRGQTSRKHVLIDTNYWKTLLHRRLEAAPGSAGAFRIFGNDPRLHTMFADQVVSEYGKTLEDPKNGRRVTQWALKPGQSRNEYLDCSVGVMVAGSICGAKLPGVPDKAKKRQRVSLSAMQGRRL